MNTNGTIWDEHVFGQTFNGRDVNVFGDSYCINEKTPLVLFGNNNEDLCGAKEFFRQRGFYLYDTYVVDVDVETVKSHLLSLERIDESVVVVTKKTLLRSYKKFFQEHGIRFQLFSCVQSFFLVFRPELRKVYQLLDDERSKEVFTVALGVRYKIFPEETVWPCEDGEQYFILPMMRKFDTKEVFVDCGAFVGDTVEKYISSHSGIFGKIYAFEPGTKQFEALACRRKRLVAEWAFNEEQIECVPCGLGARSGQSGFMEYNEKSNLLGSQIVALADGMPSVSMVSLDEFFEKRERVGFIKSDIEGMEMDLLRGASKIIKRDKPKLAICIYHKLTDYYEIPLYIKQLVPEYKIIIRHHSPTFAETVMYAYV